MASSRYHTHVHPGPEGLALDARRILDDVLSALQGARKMNAPDAPDASALMAAIANEAMARMQEARRRSKHAAAAFDALPDRDDCDCGLDSETEPPLIISKAEIH